MQFHRRLTRATARDDIHPKRRRTRRFVFFALAQIFVLIGGMAFADWLASGTGVGFAKARRAVPLHTSPATASESLYPGSTGDVAVTITNDNPFPVTVRTIAGDGAIVSGVADCDGPGNGVTFADQVGTWPIAANSSSSVTLAGAVAMASTSPDACQGATFTIPVRVSSQGAPPPPPPSSALQLSPTSKSFGGVLLGQPSPATSFTVTNTGAPTSAAPQISTGSLVFATSASTCTAPLPTGGTCSVDVKFMPTVRGAQNATLTVSVPGSTATAALNGTGQTPAQLVGQVSSVAFPPTLVGQFSTSSFIVSNTGDAASGVPAVSITGPNASDFSVTSNSCAANIAGGTQCQVVIRFAPTVVGGRNATASVTASPGGGVSVGLTGNGVAQP